MISANLSGNLTTSCSIEQEARRRVQHEICDITSRRKASAVYIVSDQFHHPDSYEFNTTEQL
uniref:Uncharacterized protein n=1 Tax=Hyaloperonospora arabidopsidis (strain Emoy2) TaxID=559515 RepID=M4BAE8_HYAAE